MSPGDLQHRLYSDAGAEKDSVSCCSFMALTEKKEEDGEGEGEGEEEELDCIDAISTHNIPRGRRAITSIRSRCHGPRYESH